MKHTLKSNLVNAGLIEQINKYKKVSIELLPFYSVQHYAAPNKGATILC